MPEPDAAAARGTYPFKRHHFQRDNLLVSKQVKRRAEAVQEGDDAESRAGGCGRVGVTRQACGSVQESLYFRDEDFREGGDGGRAVGEEAPQSLDPPEGFLYTP